MLKLILQIFLICMLFLFKKHRTLVHFVIFIYQFNLMDKHIRKFIFLNVLFLFHSISYSQGWLPMGSRSQSIANASVAISDLWSYHHNPAASSKVKNFGVGLSYENRFLLRELQSQGLTLVVPLKKGVVSTGAQSYGFSNYRTYRVGMGYAMDLTEFLSAGVQLNYHRISLTQNYGFHQTVTAEIGLLGEINDDWKIGFSVFNLTRNKLSEFMEDRYSSILRIGTVYKVSNIVSLYAEAEKHVEYTIRGKFGVEYEPTSQLYVRAGFATNPIELSFGLGYKFINSISLDIGSAYHQQLGWSPNFSLSYQLD